MAEWLKTIIENPPEYLSTREIAAAKSALNRNEVISLSTEKEVGPFYFFIMGESCESIAEKTGWSIEVIVITALYHKWHEKRFSLNCFDDADSAKHILKNTVNAILIATAAAITKQTKEVMAGTREPEECRYMPKSMKDLEKFVTMVSEIYHLSEKAKELPANAVNVQVNVSSPQQLPQQQTTVISNTQDTHLLPQSISSEPLSRKDRLKLLEEK